ncbi:hypothetical protein ACO0QE_003699 [Hanseniaspora vineae]
MNGKESFLKSNISDDKENPRTNSNTDNNLNTLDILDSVIEDKMLNQIYTNMTQKCRVKKPYMEPKEGFKKIIQDPSFPESLKYSEENIVELLRDLNSLPWDKLKDFSVKFTGNYDWFGVVTDRLSSVMHLIPFDTKDEFNCFNSYLVSINLINHYKYNVSDYQAFKGAKERMFSYIDLVEMLAFEPDPSDKSLMSKYSTKETMIADCLSLITTSSVFGKYKHSWGLLQLWIMHVFESLKKNLILRITNSIKDGVEDNDTREENSFSTSKTSNHIFNKINGSLSTENWRKEIYSDTAKRKEKIDSSINKFTDAFQQEKYLSAPTIEFLLIGPSESDLFGPRLAVDEPNIRITDYKLMINPKQNILSPDFCEADEKLTLENIADYDYDKNILNIVNLPRNNNSEILEKKLFTLESLQKELEVELRNVETELVSVQNKVACDNFIRDLAKLTQQKSELIKTINELSLEINSCLLAQNYGTVFDNYTKVMLSPELANFLYSQELKEQQMRKQRELSTEAQQSGAQTGSLSSECGTSRSQSFQHLNPTSISALTENYTKSSIITKIPFLNNSFHHISLPGVWDTIPYKKWEPLAREIFRVLKPGGMLYSFVVDFKPKNLHSATMSEFNTSREKERIFDKIMLQSTRSGHQLAPSRYLPQVLYKVGFKTVDYTYLTLKLGDFQSDMGINNELVFFILFLLFFMNMGQRDVDDIDTFAKRYAKEHDGKIDTESGSIRILVARAYKV